MPKVLSDNSQSSSRYHGKGVFTDKCKIISVEDFSNYPRKGGETKVIGKNNFVTELCLKLKVDSVMEMDMHVMGSYNWKVDPVSGKKIEYLGWKTKGNAVQNLLVKVLGVNAKINDDDSIPSATLNALVGREFYRLRYCQTKDKDYEGKPSFQTWNVFASTEAEVNEEQLVASFNKISSYIKKYDPLHYDDWNEEQKSKQTTFPPSEFAPGVEEEDII